MLLQFNPFFEIFIHINGLNFSIVLKIKDNIINSKIRVLY